MKLLLDTHVALWAIADSPQLTGAAREAILAPASEIWISAATVWEISIKHSLARGDMPISGTQAIAWFQQAGYQFLPVLPEHAAAVETLPPHHHDPFDRLLVAQAIVEPMRLVSHDARVLRYGEHFIAA